MEISSLEGKALTEARQRFGMVFQGAALFDSMTVFENVAFPLRERRGRKSRLAEIREPGGGEARVVDLGEEVLDRWPSELSGGMRKRVALARALVSEPQIVLYDEPTTGLDPITTEYVDEMIIHARERLGITSMVISHDIASAFRVADRRRRALRWPPRGGGDAGGGPAEPGRRSCRSSSPPGSRSSDERRPTVKPALSKALAVGTLVAVAGDRLPGRLHLLQEGRLLEVRELPRRTRSSATPPASPGRAGSRSPASRWARSRPIALEGDKAVSSTSG